MFVIVELRSDSLWLEVGNFPNFGNFQGFFGTDFDLLGIPKTQKSLGILISVPKVGIWAVKQGQNGKMQYPEAFKAMLEQKRSLTLFILTL